MMSMSSGAKPNFHAFAKYRGANARQTVSGRQSQKYAEVNRKWLLPQTGVVNHPGDIALYTAYESVGLPLGHTQIDESSPYKSTGE